MTKEWNDKLQTVSIALSVDIENAFEIKLQEAGKVMPENSSYNRALTLNFLVDHTIGSVVRMICKFGGDQKAIEEEVIKSVRMKFQYFRNQANDNKRVQPVVAGPGT